jgi:5'-nucleotidase / UDP-sugar diphosphatase
MRALRICAWVGISFLILLTSACILGNVTITILQTSDVHHHASGYGPFHDYTPLNTADNDEVLGGYSRLATLINKIRAEQAAKQIPVLLFDSGDYFMGTVYDMTVADTTNGPAALKFFTQMKYDAVTLGNHEFEWSSAGLYQLLTIGKNAGFNVPVVASNTNIPASDPLQLLVASGVLVNKKIIQLPYGAKIGVLGLMGPNADSDAPAARPVTFDHAYSDIQTQVNNLRNNDCAQVVIALSHGGVHNPDTSSGSTTPTGDDVDLANNVTGIDVICSGHYHTATPSAYVVGPSKTIIYEPGAYGEYLSRIDITYNYFLGKIVNYNYTLIPVNDTIKGDQAVQTMVDQYSAELTAILHSKNLPGLGDPVSSTTFDLEEAPFQVTGIGSLAADSLRAAANQVAAANGGAFDIGVVPNGVIRDGIYKGKNGVITFSDAYNMLPLGISPNDQSIPGYPLMSVYANGMEVYTICEVGLSLSQLLGSDYYLNFSGLKIYYDPSGAPGFHGVQAVYEYAPNDTFCLGDQTTPTLIDPYDPNKLYHIVVDYYALQMLYVVNSYGFSINPKNVTFIDRDPYTGGVQELKEWMALMGFLPYLPGGIPASIYGPNGIDLGRVVYP